MTSSIRAFPPGCVESNLNKMASLEPADAAGAGAPPLATNNLTTATNAAGYGLRQGSLSPMETLAQSISGACPTLDSVCHRSLGLHACRKRHLARLYFRYLRHSSGCLVHQPICALLLFARLSLFVCRDDSAAMACGDGGVEFAAGLHHGQRQQHRRFLLLRQHHAPQRHRPRQLSPCCCPSFLRPLSCGLPGAT